MKVECLTCRETKTAASLPQAQNFEMEHSATTGHRGFSLIAQKAPAVKK